MLRQSPNFFQTDSLSFEHFDAKTIHEAIGWLCEFGDRAKVLAGGVDQIALMRDGIAGPKMRMPEILINIKNIPSLHHISWDRKSGLRLGAAVTLAEVRESEVVKQRFDILAEAAGRIGTKQVRNMATIGGDLCQRPRCLYFRLPEFQCLVKGGHKCFAVGGNNRYYCSIMNYKDCVMAHPSDMATPLVALGAKVKLVGFQGSRQLLLEDFLRVSTLREPVLGKDEILTEITVPNQHPDSCGLFLKTEIRHSTDFALVSVAVVLRISGGICRGARIVAGGVSPHPRRATEAERLLKNQRIDMKLAKDVSVSIVKNARPLSMNGYKIDLLRNLVKRALLTLEEDYWIGKRNHYRVT